jgi:hypothetical protein
VVANSTKFSKLFRAAAELHFAECSALEGQSGASRGRPPVAHEGLFISEGRCDKKARARPRPAPPAARYM